MSIEFYELINLYELIDKHDNIKDKLLIENFINRYLNRIPKPIYIISLSLSFLFGLIFGLGIATLILLINL